jgi:hypothetical protein
MALCLGGGLTSQEGSFPKLAGMSRCSGRRKCCRAAILSVSRRSFSASSGTGPKARANTLVRRYFSRPCRGRREWLAKGGAGGFEKGRVLCDCEALLQVATDVSCFTDARQTGQRGSGSCAL